MAVNIKLISTDFDGTLHADYDNPPVPLDLQGLIADLQRQGAKWVINTGRDLSSVMEGIARARLMIRPDFLVTVEREVHFLDGSHYTSCEPWNSRCKREHEELFARIGEDVPKLIDWVNKRYSALLYEDAYSPFCLTAQCNEDADAIQSYLEEYCLTIPDLSFVRNDVYARFSHVRYNKGTALAEVGRLLSIAADQTLAAGDHLNDIPMLSLDHARFLVAPDNAIPKVKELVRSQNGYVSHQPWGHGVARGLEHFLNSKR